MSKTKSIPAVLAMLAIGLISADSSIGGGPYPVEIKIQKVKPTKVKGILLTGEVSR